FPIEPRQDLTIRLVFQQILPENAGTLELRYPLARTHLDAADAPRVSIAVEIESTVDLRTVYCPSHAVEAVRDGKRKARIAWEGDCTAQDKDFLLYIGRSKDSVAFSLLSNRQAGEKGTFLAVLSPVAEAKPEEILPKDVVYVLDVSGSMRGPKLEQAKAALRFGIRGLREKDRFNIVAFSTEARSFRRGLVDVDPEVKDAAVAWVDSLEAGGGTALDEALQVTLRRMRTGERLPIVALLTDGLPTVGLRDPLRIVKRVQEINRAQARIYVFGVGFDQNVAFLDRIARTTRAAREYITDGQDDLELVVSRFFKRIEQPVLSDIELNLGEGVSEVYPRKLPDLFAGDQLVVMGRYDQPGPRTVWLTGRLQGKRMAYSYQGVLAERKEIRPLPRLWAERKVEFLLEQLDLHGPNRELVDEVVHLGKKHTIVTRYTSGLVVEDGELAEPRLTASRGIGRSARGRRAEPDARPVVTDEVSDHNEVSTDSQFEEVHWEEGLVDAPWIGPSTNSAIGFGSSAGGGRRGRGGRRALTARGSSARTESATERGLLWLAGKQDPRTGAWVDPEQTGWALCAFLGAGYTDRGSFRENRYARAVRMGLRYLMTQQRVDGSFATGVRGDAIATLALCEAYWMTRNPRYRKPAQDALHHLARARRPHAAWKDVITTVHCVLAFKSGKFAGLEVDPDGFEGARQVFDSTSPKTTEERAGIVLACILMGEDPRASTRLQALAKELTPAGDDLGYLTLGTLATFQMGGPVWRDWNRWMKKSVVESQESDGSWPPVPGATRLRTTAVKALCLEVYYRYDRVFGVR
ncbi:MAG: VWA domain-containing protein, partial [Planctomycetota bacterium]